MMERVDEALIAKAKKKILVMSKGDYWYVVWNFLKALQKEDEKDWSKNQRKWLNGILQDLR